MTFFMSQSVAAAEETKKTTMATRESSCAAATLTGQNEHCPLVIEASNTEYTTIHDYVSALHPWLMGLRQDITRADNMMGDKKPDEYEHLAVDTTKPQYLSIMYEKRFSVTDTRVRQSRYP